MGRIFFFDRSDFFISFRFSKLYIHFHESLSETLLGHSLLGIELVISQHLWEMSFAILGDFSATMAVKHGKKMVILFAIETQRCDMGIFLVKSPALHASSSELVISVFSLDNIDIGLGFLKVG